MFDLARLSASGLVAGIDFHESLGSTSDRALGLAAEGAIALPHLVLAQRQTAGRGRGANRWWAADGALTFSLVLAAPPDRLPPDRWPQVALVAGLAVCDALRSLAPAAELRVKWPNDVFLAGRKVCGILSESVPGWRDRLVVGIGVNVNNSPLTTNHASCAGARSQEPEARSQEPEARSQGPEARSQGPEARSQGPEVRSQGPEVRSQEWDLRNIAAALVDHDGLPRDLTAALIAILDQFDRYWSILLSEGFVALAEEYRQRCFLTGRQ
jgi:biotin-(acetyl-CoA carboxylase) ligase